MVYVGHLKLFHNHSIFSSLMGMFLTIFANTLYSYPNSKNKAFMTLKNKKNKKKCKILFKKKIKENT